MPARRLQWLALSLALRLGPIALLTSACAPLQQAPLVYTSGQTIGVRVGSSPTQAEAIELMIGVKLLDAAYAPVAVARAPSTDLKGQEVDWGIKEIYGVFGEEMTPDAHKRLRLDELQSVQEYLRAAELLKGAETSLQTAKKDFANRKQANATELALNETKRGDVKRLQTECSLPEKLCPTERNLELAGQLQAFDQQKSVLETQRDQVSNADVLKAEEELKRAQLEFKSKQTEAVAALQKLSNVSKKDALSVYGSFNSDVRADGARAGPGAALKLGKVFSTGVAAQNLSEAERNFGQSQALTACMTGLAEIAKTLAEFPVKDRVDFLNRGMDKCVSIGKPDPSKPPG
jgi:hypothetical protein